MNNTENNTCADTHFIEEEYINDMLGLDMAEHTTPVPVTEEIITPELTASETEIEPEPELKQQQIAAVVTQKEPEIKPPGNIDFNTPYQDDSFECQILNIAGLIIALPTASINQTLKQQKIVSNNNEEDELLIGTVSYNGCVISIINIEYLIMNGISNNTNNKTKENLTADIIVLQGMNYGFIADESIADNTSNTQTIINTDVHWRDNNSQRLWLAGTVAQLGLALLDVTGAIRLLPDSIK